MKRRTFLLASILFIAFILRFFNLGKTPISLEWDEVAIGYDAYSIVRTGRDQFGKFLPLTFRSLDDYKPPIYEYLTVPSVILFGLNEFSVRLPSAFFGLASVGLTYILTQLVFSRLSQFQRFASQIAYLASFLLAISPWHLQFSRAAFEVNVSVFITILAVIFFLKGLEKNKFFLISALLFGLDLFSYHSTRVVAPLLMIFLFILFNKYLPTRKIILIFFSIFGIFFLIFIPILKSPEAQIRYKATNIFDPGARYLDEKDLQREFLVYREKDKIAGFVDAGKIFHNQRLIYTDYETVKKAAGKYLSHFGLEYLFVKGDAPLHHAPGFGLFYRWEFPFLIIGLVYLVLRGLNRYSLAILIWLFLAPLPSSVTRETPHAVRTEIILPTFQLLTALGLMVAFNMVKKQSKWVIYIFIVFISLINTIDNSYYLHQYYVHTNYELSRNWMYGRKEAVMITETIKNKYDKVLVSLKVDMPHIFWLFHSKYPPEKYLASGGTISGGFADERNHFDKYEFRNFDYYNLPYESNLLLVGLPSEFPATAKVIETIYYLDGTEALKIVEK